MVRRAGIGFGILYAVSLGLATLVQSWPELLFAACLAPSLILLSAVDFIYFIIPDATVVAIAAVAVGFLSLTGGTVLPTLFGAAAIFALFWLIGEIFFRQTGREGLGIGDAKLAAALTLVTGPAAMPLVILLASLGGIGVALLAIHCKAERSSPVPFGPFLAYAAFLVVLGLVRT